MKKWLPVVSVVCVLFVIVAIYFVWRNQQDTLLKAEYGESSYGVKLTSVDEQLEARMNRQKVITKASQLREKWRSWAYDNQKLLISMMNTRPITRLILQNLEQELPRPGYATTGVQWRDLGPKDNSPSVMLRRDTIAFTWQVPSKKRSIKEEENWQYSELSQHNDYPLMVAIGGATAGREKVTVWASGRITEEVLQKNTNPAKGEPIWGRPKISVIEPSYDFLKGK